MPLAPLATDPNYRYNPYQQFTGFEQMPQVGGPLGQMLMQILGSHFMGQTGMMPLGLSEQNMYDRLQALRLQQQHDEFLQQASQEDQESYFDALRGFSAMMGTPWERPQIEAAEALSEQMAAAGPVAIQMLPPQLIDALGGMRGMNVVMAEYMFQGGRFRIDPVTGQAGLGNEAMERLNSQVYESMFSGQAWRRGQGLSAGEAGQLFHELQRMGMVGGGTRLEEMLMQMQGVPMGPGEPDMTRRMEDAIVDRAVALGVDMGGGVGHDPRVDGLELDFRQISPEDLDILKSDPEVGMAVQTFDNRKVIRSLESYGGVIKAMREIFGDAGRPNAPIPELINSLNELTGGALPQLTPGEVETMVRQTTNLARNTGLGLEATMMLAQAANEQAMELGLPPIFGAEALQHSLAFRGAYQQLGMGANPAWGLSGQEFQMMKDMQLTTAAAGSRLANQMGAALRIQDALAPEGAPAFRPGSEAEAWLNAVRAGATTYVDPDTGETKSLNMGGDTFQRMLVEGANFDLDEATVERFLSQQASNLEQVQEYNVQDTVRMQQRDEFIEYMVDEAEFNAQEAIDALNVAGMTQEAEQGLGHAMAQGAMQRLFDMTPAQRANRETRNRLMADAVEQQLADVASGALEIRDADGNLSVTQAQGQALLDRFRADDNFRASVVEEMFGQAEEASRDQFSPFGPMSLQDALQQFDSRMLNQTAKNQAAATAEAMQQTALSPLGRSGLLRRGVQAVIDAADDPDRTIPEILAETLGGERGQEIADTLQQAGTLDELRAKAAEFERLADVYEQADTAEERAAALTPLQAARDAYRETVAEIANTARREGYRLEGAVERDDAARVILASDYVRNVRREAAFENIDDPVKRRAAQEAWATDEDNQQRMRKALQVERQRQDDLVGLLYSDKQTLARMGDRGLTELQAVTEAQAELDALATLHTGGDMSELMREIKPEGMEDEEWFEIKRQRNEAVERITKAQAYFRDALPGTRDDFNYLTEKEALTKTMQKVAGDKTYNYVSDLGELMELAEGDIEDLEKRGIITEGEADQIRAGQEEYEGFLEKIEQQKADYRATGEDILREGMARMKLGPDATEEQIEKAAKRYSAQELKEYYGGADAYAELEEGLNEVSASGRQRKHAFAELLRDRDAMSERADEEGIAFDADLGGDLSEVFENLPTTEGLDEESQEPTEIRLKLETGEVRLEISEEDATKLRAEGEGEIEQERQ